MRDVVARGRKRASANSISAALNTTPAAPGASALQMTPQTRPLEEPAFVGTMETTDAGDVSNKTNVAEAMDARDATGARQGRPTDAAGLEGRQQGGNREAAGVEDADKEDTEEGGSQEAHADFAKEAFKLEKWMQVHREGPP